MIVATTRKFMIHIIVISDFVYHTFTLSQFSIGGYVIMIISDFFF